MPDITSKSHPAEISARIIDGATTLAMTKYPKTSTFAMLSMSLGDTSLTFTFGTGRDSAQWNEHKVREFLSSGLAFRGRDIENAIKNIRTDIKTTSEGESGRLKIQVGELRDDKSVDVTYSFVEAEYVESESESEEEEEEEEVAEEIDDA
jgi:hypothetical protein